MSFFSNHFDSSMFCALRTPTLILAIVSSLVLSAGDVGGQTVEDDHGDSYDTATLVELGSKVDGRIDPGDDRDVFKIDLTDASGETDLWVYTHNPEQDVPFDTFGGLYDSVGNLIELNDDGFLRDSLRSFGIRSVVPPGVYYVILVGYSLAIRGTTLSMLRQLPTREVPSKRQNPWSSARETEAGSIP